MGYVDLWEMGSFFQTDDISAEQEGEGSIPDRAVAFASGRQALVSVFMAGARERGWTRLLLPSYFCPAVTHAVSQAIPTATYECGPLTDKVRVDRQRGDALLLVSFFGRLPAPVTGFDPADVVLDATHLSDWSCVEGLGATTVCSLRKSVPVADGAWARSLAIPIPTPPPASTSLQEAVDVIWQSMDGKRELLEGGVVDRTRLLTDHRWASERLETDLAPQAMTERSLRRASTWRRSAMQHRTSANLAVLEDRLKQSCPVLNGATFGAVLILPGRAERDQLRMELISHRVFPAILWDAPPHASASDRGFSERMLFLHADYRYTRDDVERLASLVTSSRRKGTCDAGH